MKKNLLIASVVLVIICLVAGSFIFQQRVDETRQELKMTEEKQQSDMNEEQADGEEEVGKNGSVASAATLEKEGKENERDSDQSGKVGSNSSSSSISTSSSAQTGQKEAVDSGASSQAGSGTSKPDNTNGGTPNTKVESESVTSIKNRYFPEFQKLEWEENGKLENLVQQAFNDYMDKSKTFNAEKYRSKAQALESSADISFYQKYSDMQAELVKNGHSRNAASDLEQSYQSKKAARERELKDLMSSF